jgi:hypothetical protein
VQQVESMLGLEADRMRGAVNQTVNQTPSPGLPTVPDTLPIAAEEANGKPRERKGTGRSSFQVLSTGSGSIPVARFSRPARPAGQGVRRFNI